MSRNAFLQNEKAPSAFSSVAFCPELVSGLGCKFTDGNMDCNSKQIEKIYY